MCNENEAFRALRDKAIAEIEESLKADDGIKERRRNSLEGLQDAVKKEEPEKKNISKRRIRKNKRKSEKLERKAKRLRTSNDDGSTDVWETFKTLRQAEDWSVEMKEKFDDDPMNF